MALACALAGCAVAPTQPEWRRIEGRLEGLPPGQLGAPAEWVVELRDDAADRVLAEQRGTLSATPPPIAFALTVDVARVDTARRHSLRGAVSERGLVQWLSEPRALDLRDKHADVGGLRLRLFAHPGGFASVLDCGGAALGSQPPRFERAGQPSTFVQWHDHGATVSLAGERLPRCVAQPLR